MPPSSLGPRRLRQLPRAQSQHYQRLAHLVDQTRAENWPAARTATPPDQRPRPAQRAGRGPTPGAPGAPGVAGMVALAVLALAMLAVAGPAPAMTLSWTSAVSAVPVARAAPANAAAGTLAAPLPATREFTLVAQEVDWDLLPGITVRAWTYGGTMPGPELRVTEGDLVRVFLQNTLPVPTTIHWHGVDVPNAMDGVPGLTQEAVPPGGSFTYEFTATNPGTRWYHTHQDSEVQTALGLFGPLVIEPRTPPPGAVVYSREYTYTLSEWSLALTPAVATGEASLPLIGPGAPHAKQLDFDFFLINGKAHDAISPILLRPDERVRVRLINAGALHHTIHSHGHSFKVIATDGNFVPPAAQVVKDSVTLGPSERVDIELHATNPGIWMFHCHMAHHAANGMMTTIRYEGAALPTVGGGHEHGQTAQASASGLPAAPAPVSAAPATASLPAGSDPAVAAAGAKILMTDNRFQPGTHTVPRGTTVAWVNNGTNVHNVSSFDGRVESGSIPSGKAFTYTFTQPGEYQYLCRQHLLNGMRGSIVVQ